MKPNPSGLLSGLLAQCAVLMGRCLLCALGISFVGLIGTPSTAVAQKPTRYANLRMRAQIEGSFVQKVPWSVPNPAESLEELVSDSYVIAVAQAVTNHSELAANERVIVMLHEVYVLQALQGSVSAGDTIVVAVPGGRVEFSDGSFAEWQVNDFTWPEPGRRYLWFLQRVRPTLMDEVRTVGNSAPTPVFEPVHGPLGIYPLDTDVVGASGLGRSRLAAAIGLEKLTPGVFIENVRQLVGGGSGTTSLHEASTTVTANQRAATQALKAVTDSTLVRSSPSLRHEPGYRRFSFEPGGVAPGEMPSSLGDQLARSACASDAVVVGRLSNPTGFLSEDAKTIFTEYDLAVLQVFRGGLRPGDTVAYVRPGGKLMLDGRIAEVVHDFTPELETNTRYLLFLRGVPGASGLFTVFTGRHARWVVDAIALDDRATSKSPWGIQELRNGADPANVLALVGAAVCG